MTIELTLAPTRDHFVHDGKPFFYLADTVWMTFSNIAERDWARYLDIRRRQGFTAMQISILPVTHDRSVPRDETPPFLPRADGSWDFARLNPPYFDRAERMLETMVAKGLLPSLTLLWCSYVPGTRCAASSPIPSAMALENVAPYVREAVRRFRRFAPLWFVSGDTRFESPDEPAYYTAALEAARAAWPEAKLSMHINPDTWLPTYFAERVDYYAFQSGHHSQRLDRPYSLVKRFMAMPRKLPILNSEPCYEAHASLTFEPTRWTAADIRRATWQSLLSGAKMGVTYGAHGVWSFHQPGQTFLNKKAQEPPFWQDAMDFDGAWDVGFARWLYEREGLVALDPADILLGATTHHRAAANADRSRIAVYIPYPVILELDLDLTGYDCRLVDLAKRRILTPEIQCGRRTRLALPPINNDCLLLARR